MSYLLDTNVVSETIRRNPNKAVISWLEQVPGEALFISVLTLGEIRKGIEALSEKKRRDKLQLWIDHELPRWFDERVLSVDLAVADRWGRLLAEVGRSVPTIDSLLAATALHHDLRLVTHNVRDFDYPGLAVINPWSSLS
ncbi:MAG: type II toxin-antitoxin system VapC family toxin [Nitrospirota bacterium]